MSDKDAEAVAEAMLNGPDIAEFVSDYVSMCADAGAPGPDEHEIAMAWAERAVHSYDSDTVYQDVVSNIVDQVRYYLR